MNNFSNQEQIATARQKFIKTGAIDECVPEDIAASWKKSAQFGVDAGAEVLPGKLNKDVLTNVIVQLNDRDSYFYNSEAALMEHLGAAIVFADEHFDVFAIRGSLALKDELRAKNFRFGSNLAESRIGTNAMALSFETGQECWVYGSEHYLKALKDYVCVAACSQFGTTERFGSVFPSMIIIPISRYYEGLNAIFSYILKTHMYRQNSILNANYLMYNAVINFCIAQSGLCYIAVDNSRTIIDVSDNVLTCQKVKLNQLIGLKLADFSATLDEAVSSDSKGAPLMEFKRVMLNVGPYYVKTKEVYSADKVIGSVLFLARDPNLLAQKLEAYEHLNDTDVPERRITSAKSSAYVAKYNFSNLVGFSKTFTAAVSKAKCVAESNSSVLILGESGTGKELFAQSIHNASARRGRPFVSLNCAAMPRELIDSELFGYVEGAFTGARKSGSPGKIELADGGTLFLDEIGDMPLDLQVHLLKVLEDKKVTRLGDTKPRKIDVRIIVATNQNLQSLVQQGKFRLDLYYRINVFTIRLPALRDRKEDIPDLAYCFLSQCSKSLGKNVTYISQNVLQAFKAYDWPGNLRELRNAVEYGVNLAAAQKITINDIPDNIAALAENGPEDGEEDCEPNDFEAMMLEADAETRRIIELLEKYKGNKSKVADELGMSRPALYRRLKKLNLNAE